MKQFLLIALAAVAVVGCKKNIDSQDQINPDEMRLGAQTANITKADLPSAFTANSKIGMYSVKASDFTTAFTIMKDPVTSAPQANIGYNYGGTVDAQWKASGVDVLKWQVTANPAIPEPVLLFGYHPYIKDIAFDAVAKTSIPFAVNTNQSVAADLQQSDLMWAGSTGKPTPQGTYEQLVPGYSAVNGQGLIKATDAANPINMQFNHMLSKLSFKVGCNAIVGGSGATTEKYKDVEIINVAVEGQDISASGLLDIKAGVFTATANKPLTPGDISWVGEVGYPDANIVLTQTAVDADKFVKVCDLVVLPQNFTGKTGNQFSFELKYQYSNDNGSTWSEKTKSYTTNLPVETKISEFVRNRQYDLNATLTLSSNEIFITTSIVDWTTGEAIPIQGN